MIYRIYYQGVKYIAPVKNREELMALRNSNENLEHLAKARGGDPKAKGKLLQLAYNLGRTEGKLAGCESIGSYFFHDVDCYDPEQSAAIKELVLSKKDAIGLMMLEKSPGGGWHLVCRREPGTTILESQVKVANELRIEMDTNAKNLNRVVFSTSGSEEDLPYLDDALFDEPMTAEECVQEYQRLKEREAQGLEEVPPGAKKANKHYRPWKEDSRGLRSEEFGGSSVASSQCCSQKTRTSYADYDPEAKYKDLLFRDIVEKYWDLYNDGKEPEDGDRNVLTFELAVTLRSICGYSMEKLVTVLLGQEGRRGRVEVFSGGAGRISQNARKCSEGTPKEYALQTETGTAGTENNIGREGVRRYDDRSASDAEEVAPSNQAADQERALVL